MKYRIYNYSACQKFEKLNAAGVLTDFEIIENAGDSEVDIVKAEYDVIDLGGGSYDNFLPYLGVIDWKTNLIGMADSLVFQKKIYKPFNILAETVLRVLKKNTERVDSQRPVIIVGDYYFVFTLALKLAVSGFVEIIVSIIDADEIDLQDFENKIKKIVFNLNIKTIPINDLTSTDRAGFLLISNFKKEKNKDAYELMAYFNFLSEGAIFIDCNSMTDSYLVEDARCAEIFVIDELAILKNKYEYLLEILKNSP
jgi:hypothetical protein